MTRDPRPLVQQGIALQRAGRLADAAQCYDAALAADPRHFDALQLLGVLRFRGGDLAAGLALLERAIAIVPTHGPTLNNYGNALRQAGRHLEAIAAYRAALRCLPAPNAMLLRNLGSGLLEVGDLDEAGRLLEASHRLNPQDPTLWCWIGMLESMRQRPAVALTAYRQAQALDPPGGEAWCQAQLGIAAAASAERQFADAEAALAALLQVRPTPMARVARLQLAQRLARHDGWAQDLAALEAAAAHLPAEHEALMQVLYLSDSPRVQRACAEAVARFHAQRTGPVTTPPARPRARLRIGYLSGDMRQHVVAWLFAEVLAHRDRTRFEVTVYALGPTDDSPVATRIRADADHFVAIGTPRAQDIHERIVADGIDILVDLAGYTDHARPRVLASRPAPLQIGWLGYPGTMGGQLLDYLIADATVVAAAQEGDYAEAIIRLPGSCLPNHRNRPVASTPSRADLGLPATAVVLCAFVPTVKITPPVLALWLSILRERPQTVLWLQQAPAETVANLQREAMAQGVAADRLVFAGFEADHARHLARYAVADLALDTYPYGSHSTAADALWVGCPLVSRQGQGFAARVSSSALMAVGLPQLIAADAVTYRQRILQLIDDPAQRQALRQHLLAVRDEASLFDAHAYAQHLEAAYLAAHERALAGAAPVSFAVGA